MDISAFTLVSVNPPKLEELGVNVSEAWGSTYVDEQFEVFLMVCWQGVAGADKRFPHTEGRYANSFCRKYTLSRHKLSHAHVPRLY